MLQTPDASQVKQVVRSSSACILVNVPSLLISSWSIANEGTAVIRQRERCHKCENEQENLAHLEGEKVG